MHFRDFSRFIHKQHYQSETHGSLPTKSSGGYQIQRRQKSPSRAYFSSCRDKKNQVIKRNLKNRKNFSEYKKSVRDKYVNTKNVLDTLQESRNKHSNRPTQSQTLTTNSTDGCRK